MGSARMTLPREAPTSLMWIMLCSRRPAWCTRSAACLTTSVAMSPREIDFDTDVVAGELVVCLDHGVAALAGRGVGERAICEDR